MIKEINLPTTQNKSKTILLFFWAAWCKPCKKIEATIKEIAKKHQERIDVVKIDIDSNFNIAQKYKIRAIPTLIFLENGEITGQIVGAVKKNYLEEKIKNLISITY